MESQRSLNCLKTCSQLTEDVKIFYFASLKRGDAITSLNRDNLGELLTAFPRKYAEPQSRATTKHKFQGLVFNPANQSLIDFLKDLQKLAKDTFRVAAQVIVEQFIYAKMLHHLEKSE